jgi:lactoylglutathione lyase
MPIGDEAMNIFMNLPEDGDEPRVELTYNFGVDSYELGTAYGHIAITTSSLEGALAELAKQGIQPEKPPYRVNGNGSLICFVRDPDQYRIEIIERS